MIYQAFEADLKAIAHSRPPRSAFAESQEYVQAIREHHSAVAEVRAQFAPALATEYLSEIAESRLQSVADATFALAWEHGHAEGLSAVENHYIDFANFASTVYAAATS